MEFIVYLAFFVAGCAITWKANQQMSFISITPKLSVDRRKVAAIILDEDRQQLRIVLNEGNGDLSFVVEGDGKRMLEEVTRRISQ